MSTNGSIQSNEIPPVYYFVKYESGSLAFWTSNAGFQKGWLQTCKEHTFAKQMFYPVHDGVLERGRGLIPRAIVSAFH